MKKDIDILYFTIFRKVRNRARQIFVVKYRKFVNYSYASRNVVTLTHE